MRSVLVSSAFSMSKDKKCKMRVLCLVKEYYIVLPQFNSSVNAIMK